MLKKVLLTGLIAISASVHASEIETEDADTSPPSPWESQVEFGYQSSKGNDDSQSLNGRLEAGYTSGQHRHTGEVKYYLSKEDGETDKDQLSLNLQSDYKISPDYYLYANFKGLETEYSAYFKDYTFSGGLGYQVSNTEKLLLELEFGPGYRYQNPNLDEIDDDDLIFPETVAEAILRGNVNVSWQMLDNLSFASEVTVTTGRSNTRIDSEVSLTNNITEEIALKIAQSQQYLDRVPPGLSKTDSVFSINLLFTF